MTIIIINDGTVEFERRLKAAGAFWFDWTWTAGGDDARIHEGDDLFVCRGVTPEEADYVARVREAQDAAGEAIDEARAAYAAGDLAGALKAVQRACAEEARFGDCPTYMGLRDYLEAAVEEAAEGLPVARDRRGRRDHREGDVMIYAIENTRSGVLLAVIAAMSPEAALDAHARDVGYADWADCCSDVGTPADGEIIVKPVNEALTLCRSDAGDGGWSLHAPDATDEEIASGDAPYLASGPATWDEMSGTWDRPHESDYADAVAELRRRAAL